MKWRVWRKGTVFCQDLAFTKGNVHYKPAVHWWTRLRSDYMTRMESSDEPPLFLFNFAEQIHMQYITVHDKERFKPLPKVNFSPVWLSWAICTTSNFPTQSLPIAHRRLPRDGSVVPPSGSPQLPQAIQQKPSLFPLQTRLRSARRRLPLPGPPPPALLLSRRHSTAGVLPSAPVHQQHRLLRLISVGERCWTLKTSMVPWQRWSDGVGWFV